MLTVYSILFFVATFAVVTLALLVAYSRLQRRLSTPTSALTAQLLKSDNLSSISFLHDFLEELDISERLIRRLEQANLDWSVGRLVAMMALCGAVLLAVAVYIPGIPFWAVPIAAALGAFLPYFYVDSLRSRRLQKIQDQFPDALDSLSNAMRAGHPVGAALQTMASEQPAPLGPELRKVIDGRRLGDSWEKALAVLIHRIPLIEVNFFVSAVETHLRTGGNLGEVLARLSETMRESQSLQGEIRALSAHGRMTGIVLTIMPIAIGIILSFVQPGYFEPLLNHPQGKNLIGAAIGMLLLAHFIIGKIVEVD